MINQNGSAPDLINDEAETKVDIAEINLEDETMLTDQESNNLMQIPGDIVSNSLVVKSKENNSSLSY